MVGLFVFEIAAIHALEAAVGGAVKTSLAGCAAVQSVGGAVEAPFAAGAAKAGFRAGSGEQSAVNQAAAAASLFEVLNGLGAQLHFGVGAAHSDIADLVAVHA